MRTLHSKMREALKQVTPLTLAIRLSAFEK